MAYVIGIDVGGTFTDAIIADDEGNIQGAKTPSTPEDYAVGVLNAIDGLAEQVGRPREEILSETAYLAHGTTASINALVTGDVAEVGFLTTRGHRDSIYIMNVEGRYLGLSGTEAQDILRTYKPEALVPKHRALEITERIDSRGDVIVSLNEDDVRSAVTDLLEQGVSAIAVSLLWSFQNPAHELRVREIIREMAPGMFVSLSHEVSPRIREYARSTSTIMNAQLGPPLRHYLEPLTAELDQRGLAGPLLIMQSAGGTISAEDAPHSAITTLGSVLTGGVVGAHRLAQQLGHSEVVTTDAGGTTFLVGLVVDGEPVRTPGTVINKQPVNASTVKVDVIGSGGGAIAWIDAGGNLRVGPKSATAVPGPAAYGAGGTRPTVTDADLVLGIINPDYFLGGKRTLRRDLAEAALLEHIGKPLGLSAEEAAAAVYEVQNAQTADLTRRVVVQAGHDPRNFVVYAFGGAGPIHASAYTAQLGAKELVVPLGAGAAGFSAYGLAASDIVVTMEMSDPAQYPVDPARVQENFERLQKQALEALQRQGIDFVEITMSREFDARYTAQMFEVTAAAPDGRLDEESLAIMAKNFERRYAELYGADSGFSAAGFQFINYRVRGTGRFAFSPSLPAHPVADGPASAAIKQSRPVFLDIQRGFEETDIYDYSLLRAGHEITGPAVVEVDTTTVTVPADRVARVDELGNIRITFV
ncbi:hydantoinase/oxoprolinase family protein [Nocardia nova]|uniref:hydantoinase/oxoprolinase family protein n=1 Tax=Nocardia nova TaxID=37330 RepID=UPI0037217FCB